MRIAALMIIINIRRKTIKEDFRVLSERGYPGRRKMLSLTLALHTGLHQPVMNRGIIMMMISNI
jgi:hypothetical protein